MSYTLKYTGSEIDDILDRAVAGGEIDTELAGKQDALTFDAVPTEGSTNPAESGGIYDAIQAGGATALAAFATDEASGDIATFPDGADGIPVKSLTATITPKQSGSGDPSPSNVRPISGWSGANITRVGRNLYDEAFTGIGTGSTIKYFPLQVGANKTVVASTTTPLNGTSANMFFLSGNVNTGGASGTNGVSVGVPRTATADADGYVTLGYRVYSGIDPRSYKTQIEYGTTPTDYEPYTADTIALTFGSTVYAGTLTYIGNGQYKIQPTHAYKTLDGSESWAAYPNANGYRVLINGMASGEAQTGWADWLPTVPNLTSLGIEFGRNDTRIYAAQANTITGVTDLTSWQYYLGQNNLNILYPLATLPDPIIVSGSEVRSLLGDNNIWADTGSVDVEYRADTKLYIAKVIGGGNMALSMAAPSPSLSLGRVGVLAEPEAEAEPEQADEEVEQTEEPEQTEEE